MKSENKYQKLAISIVLDAVGYVSYLFPGLGEITDVVWAPIAAFLMTKLYKGNKGKIGAAIAFIEEAMPGLDFIPSFTLMWLFTYVFTGSDKPKKTIEV